jgi:osmotically-inducible protein OsmY
MQRLLLFTLLFALPLAVAAQSTPASQPALAPATDQVLTSNGPVTLDYKATAVQPADPVGAKIAQAVRHQLLMLPYYSMFDDLEYSVQGRTVTLAGDVTNVHSITRVDAEKAVKRIEGVDKVVNNIRVLSPSPFDQQTRAQVYRALARSGSLSRYLWPQAPSIRIVVANQRVTLKGYVNSEGDKNLANIAANQVRDVFQVTNDLQVVR